MQCRADLTAVGEVDRQRPAGQRGPAGEAVALADADGGSQGAHRPRVAEFVAREAQRVQRGDLGGGLAAAPRQSKCPLCHLGGSLRVGFHQGVRGLGERERFRVRIVAHHTAYVSRRSWSALFDHRIPPS
jgi:hypothetical protein